jgi:4-hydroxybenzoate polyprenyltransferase
MERLNRIERFIKRQENKDTNIIYYVLTFFSIIFMRNFLELFSNFYDFNSYFRTGSFFFDLPLFFISFVISFILLLHVFTKEKIIKIFRIIVPFFSIILLPPIVDLIVSGYKKVYYQYILNINDFINFLKFGLIPFVKLPVLTVGLRTELYIIILLSAIYVFVKCKKYFKSILFAIVIYILFGFYAAAPVWTNFLTTLKITLIDFFFLLVSVQLILILIFVYKKKIIYFLKGIRPFVLGHFLVMIFLGLIIAYSDNNVIIELNWFNLFLLCLSIAFGWSLAVSLNDISDLKIDRTSNKSRALVLGKMNVLDYKLIAVVSFIVSLFFAIIVSFDHFIYMLIYDCIAFVYSLPPLRLKKYPIVSTSLIALASLMTVYMGFLLVDTFLDFPAKVSSLLLITITIAFNAKDLKQIEGDKKDSVWTIPVIFGEKIGRNIIAVLIFLSYLFVPFILGFMKFPILSIIFGSMSFLIIKKKKERNSILLLLYFIYLLLCCVIFPINSIF